MDGIGELIEKLCIANLKLWAVCDQKAAFVGAGEENAEKLRDLMKKDLDLCKLRAELRKEINARLGGPQGDNVKCYGKVDMRAYARTGVKGHYPGDLMPCRDCSADAALEEFDDGTFRAGCVRCVRFCSRRPTREEAVAAWDSYQH